MKCHLHRAASRNWVPTCFIILSFSLGATAGTITFGNHSSSKVINGQTGHPVTAADGIQIALYYGAIGSSSFVQMGAATTVGFPLAGLFTGGTRSTELVTPTGSSAQFQLRAWGGGFATFEQAAGFPGVLLGQSAVIQAVMGNPQGDPPIPPSSLIAGGLTGFTITANNGQTLALRSAPNKTVALGSQWEFDPPTIIDGCSVNLIISIVNTVTNGSCPQIITRTWWATDNCGGSSTCSQSVAVLYPGCLAFSARMAGSELELRWPSASNASYQVQYCTNLASDAWVDFGSPVSGNGTTNRVYDPSFSSEAQRFYRLIWLGN